MKIVIVTEYFPLSHKAEVTGGVETRAFYIAKELARNHNVTVICSWRKGEPRKQEIFGINVLRCGRHHKYTSKGAIFSRLSFALSAYKEAAKIKDADLIEGSNFISYIPANRAARKLAVPAVATYHEIWVGEWIKNKGFITGVFGSIWERIALKLKWDKIISVSNFTKRKIVRQGIHENKVVVINNGVDLKEYEKLKAKKFNKPTICYLGRLTPKKRVTDLINALAIIKNKIPDIQCKISGDGQERAKIENLIKKLDLEKNVELLGYVKNHDELMRMLKSSHILCLPSILEGFGIVIVEAMACGVPYICSDIEVLKEITENGKGGFLFKKENFEDLAEKMLHLLSDKKLYEKKVREGKEMSKKYEWKNIAKKVESVYKELA